MSETTELHGGILLTSFGQQVLFVEKSRYVATMKKLVDDGFDMCCDLTAVDYLNAPNRTVPEGVVAERFEVVV
ncbi:MAG: NADH-quinone oxidoreductase subunit C, partial [Actinobacteria bacterium]|nr:NADH-quinone oxidoreductase subunit C [Actinomycetota bacterium]